jgi:hypothetical protein
MSWIRTTWLMWEAAATSSRQLGTMLLPKIHEAGSLDTESSEDQRAVCRPKVPRKQAYASSYAGTGWDLGWFD